VQGWVERQDPAEMLAAMNRVPVAAGDAVLVPAGTLHAIGAGILLLELQEPTDLSVLLEFERFGVDSGAEHLQLGWDVALSALDRGRSDPRDLTTTVATGQEARAVQPLLPAVAGPYFRAERLRAEQGPVELEPAFAVLVAVDGAGTLRTERGGELELRRGLTALVPYGAGHTSILGAVDVIRCLPPEADTEEGAW
jgi:mannose-6-phosphate isomerase